MAKRENRVRSAEEIRRRGIEDGNAVRVASAPHVEKRGGDSKESKEGR